MNNDKLSSNSGFQNFSSLIFYAILIEALITYFNEFFMASSFSWQMLVSMVLGITVSIFYNVDITLCFKEKSQAVYPYVGCVITGIIFSRGSNYVYDFLSKFTK